MADEARVSVLVSDCADLEHVDEDLVRQHVQLLHHITRDVLRAVDAVQAGDTCTPPPASQSAHARSACMSAAAAWTGARIDPIERRDQNLPALRTARAMALHATCASRTNHQAFAVVNESTTSLLWVKCSCLDRGHEQGKLHILGGLHDVALESERPVDLLAGLLVDRHGACREIQSGQNEQNPGSEATTDRRYNAGNDL